MNFLGDLSLNINILIGIIGACEFVKKLDKNNKLKRFYSFFPIMFAALISIPFIGFPFKVDKYLLTAFVYASISSFLYNIIKDTLLNTNGMSLFGGSSKPAAPTTATQQTTTNTTSTTQNSNTQQTYTKTDAVNNLPKN